ncbi:triple tyrosine motif-containing protein [Massilia sp.]|uniref:sensor histidine kinase n=1 Tax=Massilia sp. TaxID=1882437 RepID=UPI0028A2A4BC|nr:triple tyrosine motif-containing protein [Massilia sp.]
MMMNRGCALVLTLFLLFYGSPARALDPNTPAGAYRHDMFDARAGAPPSAMAIAQTADGWLWFGAPSGLYRHDGVRFEVFHGAGDERLLGRYVTMLAPRENGELWIGYLYGGLSVLHHGHLRHVAVMPAQPLGQTYAMAFDGDDAWAATSTGFWRYRAGAWTRGDARMGLPGRKARYVHRDTYGRLWASDERQLYLFDRAAARFAPVLDVAHSSNIKESLDGRVWIADDDRVRLLPEPEGGWRARAAPAMRANTYQSLFDRDGNYWSTDCPFGLCVRRPGQVSASFTMQGAEHLPVAGGKAGVTITSLFEDREGNLWAASTLGVGRLRDSRMTPLAMPAGADWPTLALDGDDNAWIASDNMGATSGSLWRLDGNDLVSQAQHSRMVVAARDGAVLAAGEHTIERRRGSRVLERLPLPAPAPGQDARAIVLLLAEDREGIWAHLAGRGLFRHRAGAWEPPARHPSLALAVYAFVDAAGRTWFGTRDGRVVLADGDAYRSWGKAEGVDVGAITFIDASRELLVAGDGGMAVWQAGRFRALHADGVDLANVSGIVVSADGDRWLNTVNAVLHVRAADWQRSMDDPAQPLRGEVWDELQGHPGISDGVSPAPTLRQAGDGTIWVVGVNGISRLDRARVRRNEVAPLAEVSALLANGRRYPGGDAGLLAPGTERLQFEFTAPSLSMPERVRFQYRLEGSDRDWQDAGTRRSAWYTNLGPGEYRFEVRAVNEDGVIGPVVSSPAFSIGPHFTQTGWFLFACTGLAGAAIYCLYLLRLAQVKRRWKTRMHERMAERERIARTLHDTFLQTVQAMMLHLDVLAARLRPGSGERQQLERLLDGAQKAVEEGRSQMLELRGDAPPAPLAAALRGWAEMLRTGDEAHVLLSEQGAPHDLAPQVRAEVESIGCEAIANALRHARASCIDVQLDWTGKGPLLRVCDDGVGMPAGLIAAGRAGHWGLPGMRERAANIGATLVVRNRAAGGLEVVLTLAGNDVQAPLKGGAQAGGVRVEARAEAAVAAQTIYS